MTALSFLRQQVVVGSFRCNCQILICPQTGDAALIDPGDEPEVLLERLADMQKQLGKKVVVRYLLHTHGHLDHIGGTRRVRDALARQADLRGLEAAASFSSSVLLSPAIPKIALHRGDETLYQALREQGQFFGFQYEAPHPVDYFLEDGEELLIGALKLSVIHTPGHSPGSVCLRLHESQAEGVQESLFSGDTLFFGSVGRTDLWGSNQDQLFRSLHQRVLMLDPDTLVFPGHGKSTSIGVEKKTNLFLRR